MNYDKMRAILNKIRFDEVCSMCDENDEFPTKNCKYCGGTGYKLTGAGESLIMFLRRHEGLLK